MYDTGVRAEPSCGWGVERWEDRGRRVGRGGREIEWNGKVQDVERRENKRERERDGVREKERSRRAVSWRLRTVSWNEFCWINKFHYKNTLALSRGVSECWFYPCLSVSANRYTAYMGPPPTSLFSSLLSSVSPSPPSRRASPLSMYPPPHHSTMYE